MRMEFRFSVAKGQFTDEGNNDKQVCILYDILRLFPCGLSLSQVGIQTKTMDTIAHRHVIESNLYSRTAVQVNIGL